MNTKILERLVKVINEDTSNNLDIKFKYQTGGALDLQGFQVLSRPTQLPSGVQSRSFDSQPFFQAISSMQNAERIDMARDQFNYNKIKDFQDYTKDLFKSTVSSIKGGMDPNTQLYMPAYSSLMADMQKNMSEIKADSFSDLMAGDTVSAYQKLQGVGNFMNDPKFVNAMSNSKVLNMLSDIGELAKKSKENIGVDYEGVLKDLNSSLEWIKNNPNGNLLEHLGSDEAEFDIGNYLYDKAAGKKDIDILVGGMGSQETREALYNRVAGDSEMEEVATALIEGKELTSEDLAKIAMKDKNMKGYFGTRSEQDITDYFEARRVGALTPEQITANYNNQFVGIEDADGKIIQVKRGNVDAVRQDIIRQEKQRETDASSERRQTTSSESSIEVARINGKGVKSSVTYISNGDGTFTGSDGKFSNPSPKKIAEDYYGDAKASTVVSQLQSLGIDPTNKKVLEYIMGGAFDLSVIAKEGLGEENLEELKKIQESSYQSTPETIKMLNQNSVIRNMSTEDKDVLGVFLADPNLQNKFYDEYFSPTYIEPAVQKFKTLKNSSKFTENQLKYIAHHQPNAGGYFIQNGKVDPSVQRKANETGKINSEGNPIYLKPGQKGYRNVTKELKDALAKIGDGNFREERRKVESFGGKYDTITKMNNSSAIGADQILANTYFKDIKEFLSRTDSLTPKEPEASSLDKYNNIGKNEFTREVKGKDDITYIVTNNPELKKVYKDKTPMDGDDVNELLGSNLPESSSLLGISFNNIDEEYIAIPKSEFEGVDKNKTKEFFDSIKK